MYTVCRSCWTARIDTLPLKLWTEPVTTPDRVAGSSDGLHSQRTHIRCRGTVGGDLSE